jgi:hypothetical protein
LKNGTLQDLRYGYDQTDNVSSIADKGVTSNSQSFQFDFLNRLTNATGAYGTLGWTYDPVGSRT